MDKIKKEPTLEFEQNGLPKIKLDENILKEYQNKKKSPGATLYELYAKYQLVNEIEFRECQLDCNSKKSFSLNNFGIQVVICGVEFKPGSGSNKKSAKENAAKIVLNHLQKIENGLKNPSVVSWNVEPTNHLMMIRNDFKENIVNIVVQKIELLANELLPNEFKYLWPLILRQNCAAFVLSENTGKSIKNEVVSLGWGNYAAVTKKSAFAKASKDEFLKDCSALALARRGLLKYLQSIIKEKIENKEQRCNILNMKKQDNLKFVLNSNYHLQLVLFQQINGSVSFIDDNTVNEEISYSFDSHDHNEHQLNILNEKQLAFNSNIYEDAENIYSNSDKLLKWNYLGVNGVKLCEIEPIFIESIIAPMEPSVLASAVCCRLINAKYHPCIMESNRLYLHPKFNDIEKKSVNWSADDNDIEIIKADTGFVDISSPVNSEITYSRLSLQKFKSRTEQLRNLVKNSEYYTIYMNRSQFEKEYRIEREEFANIGWKKEN